MQYDRLLSRDAFGFDCHLEGDRLRCAVLLTKAGVELPLQTTLHYEKQPALRVQITQINNGGFRQCCDVIRRFTID